MFPLREQGNGPQVWLVEIGAQADTAGHSREAELELLLTHGVLHLLGHDHQEPDEHAVMFALQEQLLAQWRESGTA